MPSREARGYELNEASWLARSVDETVWISKNTYVTFSEAFKGEPYFNRGGFLGVEKVPEDAVEAIEEEFAKRKRSVPSIFVEDGRPWDKMRAILSTRGYVEADRMLVMESMTRAKGESAPNPSVGIDLVGPGSRGSRDLQDWVQTYLQAFYGSQRHKDEMTPIMKKNVKDKKASVLLARLGGAAAGCGVMLRTAGGVVGAYCIGTAPQFRGKGVAATMLKHIRELARKEGRRLVLQTMASDELEGFYRKQGFTLAYTKSLFERRRKEWKENGVPSGEVFGVGINRDAAAGTTKRFTEVFSGFEAVEAVRSLFGQETDVVISNLKISLDSPRGYLRVDGETGNVIINPEYLRTGHERHLYLDAIHELAHVKQFREGRELYDRRYAYFDRPTEIEAYKVAVEEARRIGMGTREIVDYLRVEWVTEEEFMRFVEKMRIEED